MRENTRTSYSPRAANCARQGHIRRMMAIPTYPTALFAFPVSLWYLLRCTVFNVDVCVFACDSSLLTPFGFLNNAGKYADTEANTAESDCQLCSAGKYSTVRGSVSNITCTDCGAGKYLSSRGNDQESDCMSCPRDTYSTRKGAVMNSTCEPCPAHSSSPIASPALSACTCNQVLRAHG